MATENQQQVIKKTLENLGKKKIVKGRILKESKYKESIQKNPKIIYESKGVKEGLEPIIKQLKEERERAIKLLKRKISRAQYHHLIEAIDKLTKNIQLLSGGKTDSGELIISWQK